MILEIKFRVKMVEGRRDYEKKKILQSKHFANAWFKLGFQPHPTISSAPLISQYRNLGYCLEIKLSRTHFLSVILTIFFYKLTVKCCSVFICNPPCLLSIGELKKLKLERICTLNRHTMNRV